MSSDNQAHVVVIGASHAGLSAAINLKKRLPEAKITLIERGEAEGMSFVGADGLLWVSGDIPEEHMIYATPESVSKKGIDLHLQTAVENIDFERKFVATDKNSNISYDYLVLATGSEPIVPQGFAEALNSEQFPKRVQTFKTIQDAYNLAELVRGSEVKRFAVVGGGYIGVETAETLTKALVNDVASGCEVSLYQAGGRLLPQYYDAEFAALVEKSLTKEGVRINYGIQANSPEDVDADAIILAIGFRASSDLGGDAIERVNGAYDVDKYQATSVPDVYAIGDCSISHHNALQKKAYIAIGSNTAREASIVADVIAAKVGGSTPTQENRGTQGSNALTICGLNLAATGLNLAGAKRAGFEAVSVDFNGTQIAPYLYPRVVNGVQELPELDGGKVMLRLVYEAETRRLLGAQMATHTDAIYALHMLSLAIERGLTIDEIRNTDLYFSPQVNQLYNVLTRTLSQT